MKNSKSVTIGSKNIVKRLGAYSAAAAATAVATQGTANAAEVVWDITDITVEDSGSSAGVFFNMVNGSTFPAQNSAGAGAGYAYYKFAPLGLMRLHPGDGGYIYGPAYAAVPVSGLGFVGTSAYNVSRLAGAGSVVSAGDSFNVAGPFYSNFFAGIFEDNWEVGQQGFIGIRFLLDDGNGGTDTHYGWADITRVKASDIDTDDPLDGIPDAGAQWSLNAFGYNDTPGAASVILAERKINLSITSNASNEGNYDFEWDSKDGKVYDLVSATDLTTEPSGWSVWNGNVNIDSGGTTTTLTNVPGGDNPTRFFAVVEKSPPPLFSANFESGDGGFVATTTAGTPWAHGTPASSDNGGTANLGGSVTEGNGGSPNAWGTDLGNPGYYVNPTTEACLSSSDINLSAVAGAELSFAQARDFPAGDTATVSLIDAATGDPIVFGDFPLSVTDPDETSADWGNAGPYALPVGRSIRIKWSFTGTAGGTNDYMGWYIDDVTVNQTTP